MRRLTKHLSLASAQVNEGAALSMTAHSCESGVPFGLRALASHCAPWLLLRALAGEGVRLSSKRNGVASFDSQRVVVDEA